MANTEFLHTYWGKKFCHIQGDSNRFSDLLPWSGVNDILESHQLSFPRLRVAKDGESASTTADRFIRRTRTRRGTDSTELDTTALTAELRQGATLIIDAVDDLYEPVRALAVALEATFQEPVQANAYAGWGTSKGFDLHWDDHDVIVVQIAGRKYWQIHGVTRDSPMYRDKHIEEKGPQDPIWTATLNAGDVLYIPRGWWHVAQPKGEPTLHLSFGVNRRTGVDFIGWLQDRLRDQVVFRRDLPRLGSTEEKLSRLDELRNALADALSADLLQEYFEAQNTRTRSRPRMSLPWSAMPDGLPPDSSLLRTALPRPHPLPLKNSGTDGVALSALGKTWEFSAICEPLLRKALDGSPHQLKDLINMTIAGLSQGDLRDLLRTLLLEGLLYVVDSDARLSVL